MGQRRWLVVVLATLVVGYVLALPTTLSVADAGEFAALAVRGGIAHPPGYPLYTRLLQLAAAVAGFVTSSPPVPLVTVLASLSVAAVVVAAALLFDALRVVTSDAASRAVAVVVVGTAQPVWRAASDLEPFGLHLLLVSVVCAACVRAVSDDDKRMPAALGAAFGLGLCHHHTLVLLAPVGLAALVVRARRDGAVRTGLHFTAGFIVGCAPLLHFVATPKDGPVVWGDWTDFPTTLRAHLLRADYGTTSLAAGAQGPWYAGPCLWLTRTGPHLSVVWALVALVGTVGLVRHTWREATTMRGTSSTSLLAMGAIGSGVAMAWFFMLFRVPLPPGVGWSTIIERFFAMPDWLLAFPVAHALARARAGGMKRSASIIVGGAMLTHVVVQATTSLRWQEHAYEAAIDDIVAAAGPGSVVLTKSDAQYAGLLYARFVRGDDVEGVQVQLWRQPGYRASTLHRLWPRDVVQDEERLSVVVDRAIAQGRTVYATSDAMPDDAVALAAWPVGPLLRVVPVGTSMPTPLRLYDDAVRFDDASHMKASLQGHTATDWEAPLALPMAANWDVIAEALAATGSHDEAQDARARAAWWHAAFEAARLSSAR